MKKREQKVQEASERLAMYTNDDDSYPCAKCKEHRNNPSWCMKHEENVGRRHTCKDWVRA